MALFNCSRTAAKLLLVTVKRHTLDLHEKCRKTSAGCFDFEEILVVDAVSY